jgi:anti-sigma-K factor RskA
MSDHLQAQRAAVHARCWQQLPWWLNGTLLADDARTVEQHVAECTLCATELELQRALQARLRDSDGVTIAPQSAWQKMARRLDDEDEALARGHFKVRPKHVGVWQWAVVAQALVIVALVAWQPMSQPSYETLTAVADATPTRGSVRVVFRHDVNVDEVNAILRQLSAQIVAGPSEAGVYTLALPTVTQRGNDSEHAAILQRLRSDARIVFAEPELRQ